MAEYSTMSERAKEEQHAAVTAIGLLERQLARLIATGGDAGEIDQIIDTKAQLSKDAHRIGVEVAADVMSRNLVRFMDMMEAHDAARRDEAKQLLAGQQSIVDSVASLQVSSGALAAQLADMARTVQDTERRLTVLETAFAAQRESARVRYAELQETIGALAMELRRVAERTIAEELTAEQRRTLTAWLLHNIPRIDTLLGDQP